MMDKFINIFGIDPDESAANIPPVIYEGDVYEVQSYEYPIQTKPAIMLGTVMTIIAFILIAKMFKW